MGYKIEIKSSETADIFVGRLYKPKRDFIFWSLSEGECSAGLLLQIETYVEEYSEQKYLKQEWAQFLVDEKPIWVRKPGTVDPWSKFFEEVKV